MSKINQNKNARARGHLHVGRWTDTVTPKKGWTCVDVEDLGENYEQGTEDSKNTITCEMCSIANIRYVHIMRHPATDYGLRVGCVCAGKMEDNAEAAKVRDLKLQNRAKRLRAWCEKAWSKTKNGDDTIKKQGYIFSIHQDAYAWRFAVRNQETHSFVPNSGNCLTKLKAKKSAFLWLEHEVHCQKIVEAASCGNLSELQNLIKTSERVSDSKSTQALTGAIKNEHFDCARALLEMGIPVNYPDAVGLSPMQWLDNYVHHRRLVNSASEGNLLNVQNLLSTGDKLLNLYAANALSAAAENGHLDCVIEFLRGTVPANYPNVKGLSSLMCIYLRYPNVSLSSNVEVIVRLLLQEGCYTQDLKDMISPSFSNWLSRIRSHPMNSNVQELFFNAQLALQK